MHPLTRSGSILAALLALACDPASAAIAGRVTGPDGEPRAGTVRVLENPDDPSSIPRVVRSGKDGRFELGGLGDGPLWVRVESPGLRPVVLKNVAITAPLGVRLEAGSSLQGRVVDQRSGEGLPDATIWVCVRDAERFGFDACAEHTAGAGGRFTATGVPLTPVRLGAASPGHAFAAIELPARHSDNAFHLIELENGAPLSGRVVDDRGRPMPGARIGRDEYTVPFTDATEMVFDPPLITDEDGEFRHPGVKIHLRGVYRGLVDGWYGVPSGWVSPVKGTLRKLELTLERPATLQFGLAPVDGDLIQPRVRLVHHTLGGVSGPEVEAGPDGRYRVDDLPTRPLELKLTIEGYQPIDLGEVPLGPGKTTDLGNLPVDPGVAVNGTVVDGDGNPVEESWVELVYLEPVKFDHRKKTEDGAFRFEGVPPKVEVRLTSGADGFDVFDETLAFDRDTEMEISLTRFASIRGRILKPDGEPATRFVVHALSQDNEERLLPAMQEVDSVDGRFFLWPIEPTGRQTLEVLADGFKLLLLPDVIVNEQQGVDVGDVYLELGHTLEGLATRPDGSAAEGSHVWVTPRSSRNLTDYAESFGSRTNRDGRYAITGLSPGFFVVNAQHPEFAPWSRELHLVEDVTTETLNIEFSDGGTIHGTARDRAGVPVPDVSVAVECPTLAAERSTSTDAQGYYRIGRLPDVQCRIGAYLEDGAPFGNPKLVAVVAGRESQVDFDLSRSITVTGVVRVGGRIANRGFVTFQTTGGFGGHEASTMVEQGSGRYRVELSEPGEYRVRVESGLARSFATVRIGNERSVERNFDIPVNWILGRVVDAEGNPLVGARVSGSNGELDLPGMRGLYTESNRDGRFALKYLEPGTYTVGATKAGYRPARSDPIRVQNDTRIDNLELVLDLSLAQIRGRLVD
ncbi:MAG: carboxypeptidase-like regulatory domain-containing protein, partial [Acidobacteriota bacterium]